MTVTPPPIPTAEELYDSIMRGIEPELVRDQIPLLDEKYKDETPEQKTARMERYTKAFAAYDIAVEVTMKDLTAKVASYRRQALQEAENEEKGEEQGKIRDIEQKFS